MSEIDDDEVVLVHLPPEEALARVYLYCTSEYFVYEGLYRKAKHLDASDTLQFAGVARQASRVVDLIRMFNPEIAREQDDRILEAVKETGGELLPVPPYKERDPDVQAI